jgi:type I restriction enzyme, S subunit
VLQPPRPEQDQIVAYLRAQDAQIARFIKAKRDLIALLTEQRLRVIHEAVTCGIDVTGEQKYSEVEWIGNIPAHWVVAALNSRYRIDLGKMLDESSITGEHLIPYLRNQDVQWGHVRTKSLPEMDIRPNEVARYTLQKGDLLVCEGGDIGRSAFWDGSVSPCGYQKALHRVRPRSSGQDEPRYLYYLLYLASKRGIFIADGSINTIAHLTAEKLRRHRFCFPPYEEQKKISEWLDSSLVYIEKAISSATEEIDLIREYRNKVVADVVTGQIDVRAWQPGPEDLITEEDLTALGGDDDIDTTEEETDGDD